MAVKFKMPNNHVPFENDSGSDNEIDPDIESSEEVSDEEEEDEEISAEDGLSDSADEDDQDKNIKEHHKKDVVNNLEKSDALEDEDAQEEDRKNKEEGENEEEEEEEEEGETGEEEKGEDEEGKTSETEKEDKSIEDRLSGSDADSEASDCDTGKTEESGMASVMARILAKEVSKGKRVLLAKGKTDREVLNDIKERKRKREALETGGTEEPKSKTEKEIRKEQHHKEEKRKIWESMSRSKPSVFDKPKETRLRKIATQGMVQLFQSVHQHQNLMKQKMSSAGSERKKDAIMQEFTKGKFLDMLKPKDNPKSTQKAKPEPEHKWKILQDDYMMGAQLKDWDKEDNSSDEGEQPMDDDDMSGSDND